MQFACQPFDHVIIHLCPNHPWGAFVILFNIRDCPYSYRSQLCRAVQGVKTCMPIITSSKNKLQNGASRVWATIPFTSDQRFHPSPPRMFERTRFQDLELLLGGFDVHRLRQSVSSLVSTESDREILELQKKRGGEVKPMGRWSVYTLVMTIHSISYFQCTCILMLRSCSQHSRLHVLIRKL